GDNADPAVAVALTLYTIGVSQPQRRSVAALAAACGLTVAAQSSAALTFDQPPTRQALPELLLAEVVVLAAAWCVAAVVVGQRGYAARLADQRGRHAVAEERLRIARDLHDVVAHSLTVITAKAAVTNYLIESHPDQVRDALTTIETTGREAL